MSDCQKTSIDDGDSAYRSFRRKKIVLPLRSVYSCPSQVNIGFQPTSPGPPQTNNVQEDPTQEEREKDGIPVPQQAQTQEAIDMSSIQQMRSAERTDDFDGEAQAQVESSTDDYDEEEVQVRRCWASWSCLCYLHSMLYHCVWKEDEEGYRRLSLKSLCRREDTCGKNVKKALILTLFVPFLPCIIVGFMYRSLLK